MFKNYNIHTVMSVTLLQKREIAAVHPKVKGVTDHCIHKIIEHLLELVDGVLDLSSSRSISDRFDVESEKTRVRIRLVEDRGRGEN